MTLPVSLYGDGRVRLCYSACRGEGASQKKLFWSVAWFAKVGARLDLGLPKHIVSSLASFNLGSPPIYDVCLLLENILIWLP